MPPRARRKAFTLVELLVVIGIIAVLMAMLLAAIQKVREAANRVRCGNNLKQIGIALHMYHNDYKKFPPGHSNDPSINPEHFGQPYHQDNWWCISWMARILPYIEQDSLYKRIKPGAWPWWHPPGGLPGGGYINGVKIKLYHCPSDPRSDTTGGPYPDPVHGDMYVAYTDYLGVNGTNQFAFDGILFINSRIRIEDIKDGTSNTILVGERPPSFDEYWGWWFAGSGPYPWFGTGDITLGSNEIEKTGYAKNVPEYYRPGSLNDPDGEHTWHFWSLHSGGANFLFADWSVRPLKYSIYRGPSDDVLLKLATRAKGEVINATDLD